MKGSLLIISFFILGCIAGFFDYLPTSITDGKLSEYVLFPIDVSRWRKHRMRRLVERSDTHYPSKDPFHSRRNNHRLLVFRRIGIVGVVGMRFMGLSGNWQRICLLFTVVYFNHANQNA